MLPGRGDEKHGK